MTLLFESYQNSGPKSPQFRKTESRYRRIHRLTKKLDQVNRQGRWLWVKVVILVRTGRRCGDGIRCRVAAASCNGGATAGGEARRAEIANSFPEAPTSSRLGKFLHRSPRNPAAERRRRQAARYLRGGSCRKTRKWRRFPDFQSGTCHNPIIHYVSYISQ